MKAQAKDAEESYLLKRIKGKVNKKIYITIDMNKVLNPDFYNEETYKVALETDSVRTSPQLSDITFKFPNIPLYGQKNKYSEVIFKLFNLNLNN